MPIADSTFVRRTAALLLVGLLALLAIVGVSYWLAGRTTAYSEALVEFPQIRRTLFGVSMLVQDAEAGQRGYLLTGDEAYLEPYNNALARLQTQLATLQDRVRHRPDFDGAVRRLAELTSVKLAELEETVALAQAGRMDEAMEIVRTDRGRIAMQAVRSVTEELLALVNSRLDAAAAALQASVRALTWVLFAGGFAVAGVVGGATWITWGHTRDLERARAEVVALNVTLEERVRERAGDLARANDEIQRFAYIVSHDLRSPLVNVMGFTSELETGLAAVRAYVDKVPASDDALAREAIAAVEVEMPEAIGFIRSSTSKMDTLINAILRLSREGHRVLNPEKVDMASLIETAADSVRHQLGENGGEIEVARPMPEVNSDRLALEQIFGNLIDNAVKYLDPERAGRIVVRGRETRTGVEYEVEDNGRGIPPEDHERIFELFRRSGAQDRPGEGIGLSHVRALVRRLGGSISVESSLGKGAIFRVRLPSHLPLTSGTL
jgi:signal transduction histidine kinase